MENVIYQNMLAAVMSINVTLQPSVMSQLSYTANCCNYAALNYWSCSSVVLLYVGRVGNQITEAQCVDHMFMGNNVLLNSWLLVFHCKCFLCSPTKCISEKLQPDQLICLKWCCRDTLRAKWKKMALWFEIIQKKQREGGSSLWMQFCFTVN